MTCELNAANACLVCPPNSDHRQLRGWHKIALTSQYCQGTTALNRWQKVPIFAKNGNLPHFRCFAALVHRLAALSSAQIRSLPTWLRCNACASCCSLRFVQQIIVFDGLVLNQVIEHVLAMLYFACGCVDEKRLICVLLEYMKPHAVVSKHHVMQAKRTAGQGTNPAHQQSR